MRNYEIALLLSSKITEEAANQTVQVISSFIQDQGGILLNQDLLTKRALPSPLSKGKNVFFTTVSFRVSQEHLADIEKKVKEINEVMRFSIIKPAERKASSRSVGKIRSSHATGAKETSSIELPTDTVPTETAPIEEESREKVNLQELDDKLEEIFKEKTV